MPLLFGTNAWFWMRSGGARSSRGRIPIGQRKSVLWSVGSKTLRDEVEGFVVVVLPGGEEVIVEEDGIGLESGEIGDGLDEMSYSSSSSSSNMIEERSIGGSGSLLRKAEEGIVEEEVAREDEIGLVAGEVECEVSYSSSSSSSNMIEERSIGGSGSLLKKSEF